jgi:hypothetical protein
MKFIDSLDTHIKLEYLTISETSLKKIPKTIFTLTNLKYLKLLYWENLLEVSSDIKKLNKLEVLSFISCSLLTKIPKEVGHLVKLKELDVRWSNIQKLPDELSNLINLERLNGEPYIRINNKDIKKQSKNESILNKNIFLTEKLGNLIFPHKNLLLKGVPGTGKSKTIENIIENNLKMNEILDNVLRINIHSASSNSDLMQGISISTNENNDILYSEKRGAVLKHIFKAMYKPKQPFVLVLEEIQENSLNELIGDLIYLIEKDKRTTIELEDEQELSYDELVNKVKPKHFVELPNLVDNDDSNTKMIMPNNLYVFCTSNYRDDRKVIEDNLLRRFDVVEIYPQYQDTLGEEIFKSKDVSDFLAKLNKTILTSFESEIHPDRYLIGHANWLNIEDDENKTEEEKEENKKLFYTALLKFLVEFKEIREVDFETYTKEIIESVCTNNKLSDRLKRYIKACDFEYSTYKEMIEKLQKEIYSFLK